MTVENPRIPDHPIDRQFVERWSPRAFTGETISSQDLNSIFEAARWAPSSYNSLPWRFVFAQRGTEHFDRLLSLLNPFNRSWAQEAGALVIVVSATTFVPPGKTESQASRSHSFDAGAAWASLALQATKLGWYAHGIAGFDAETARTILKVPDDHAVEIAIAIGRRGDAASLPEGLRERETPNGRKPLSEIVFEGTLPA